MAVSPVKKKVVNIPKQVKKAPLILCKVLVVGNSQCGKTSLIRRYASDSFDSKYNTTVGTDFKRKDVEIHHQKEDKSDSQMVCDKSFFFICNVL